MLPEISARRSLIPESYLSEYLSYGRQRGRERNVGPSTI